MCSVVAAEKVGEIRRCLVSVLLMQGKGSPSPAPHPRKRRFAQTRRDGTAVQIPSRNLFGLSHYKAITRFDRWSVSAMANPVLTLRLEFMWAFPEPSGTATGR